MITDARANEAFEYLRDHTDAIGDAKAELERSKIMQKRVRQRFFLTFDGSVAAREAAAEVEAETEKADERYVMAVQAFERLKAKQEVETIVLDCWRTESANRRRS